MAEMTPKKQQSVYSLYRVVFGSPEGEKVLKHLMRKCHVFTSTFQGDSQMTAFNEGQRHVALSIMKTLKIDQDKLLRIMDQLNRDNDDNG